MRSWVLLGLAAVARAAAASSGALPVYIFHENVVRKSGVVYGQEDASSIADYFLGSSLDTNTEDYAAIARQIPAQKADEESALFVIEDADAKYLESRLGSADFYLEQGSDKVLTKTVDTVDYNDIKSALRRGKRALKVSVGLNLDEFIDLVEKLNVLRIMVVAVSHEQQQKQQQKQKDAAIFKNLRSDSAENNGTRPYISIPNFFDSKEDCLSLTNSCSGKGSCVKGSNQKYQCACKPTKEGDYTYYWGGSDCSKRDVSIPFNLIVGTTLAIVVAGALSVKLLFTLGSEPLPGVLTTSSI